MKDSIGFCRVILNYHLLVTRNELVLDSRSHLCREKKKFEKIYSGNKLDRCKLLSFERNLSLVINSSLPLVFRYYSNGGRRGGEGESKSDENIPISHISFLLYYLFYLVERDPWSGRVSSHRSRPAPFRPLRRFCGNGSCNCTNNPHSPRTYTACFISNLLN